MRTTIAKFALTAVVLASITGCGAFGAEESGESQPQGQQAPAAGGSSDGGGDSAGADDGGAATSDEEAVVLSETIAESSMEIGDGTLTFELKGITANSHGATAHGVLTSTGDKIVYPELHDPNLVPEGVPTAGSSTQINALTVTDPSTGNLHTPAYTSDGHCLCTSNSGGLEPGESLQVYAQYAPLPDGTDAVVVNFGQLGSFENIPVTWS